MNKSTIIAEVGKNIYDELCKQAERAAPKTGGDSPLEEQFISDIPHEIMTDFIWESDLSVREKIQLTFDLYDDMPCYAYLMYLKLHYSDFAPEEKLFCLHQIRNRINSGKLEYSKPAAYSLWVDFFEDQSTVRETWEIMTDKTMPEEGLQQMLIASGPVPFELKKELYERLIRQKKWHCYIFRSLLHSRFDVYGQLNRKEARKLLEQLDLPEDTEHLALLRKKLV